MNKYIAIIFTPESNIFDDIESISNSMINVVDYEGVSLASFESAMTKNEVNTFLLQNEESPNRFFILTEIENIKINLPEEIIDYLQNVDVDKAENFGSKSIFYFDNKEDLIAFHNTLTNVELNYATENFDLYTTEKQSPNEYVDNLSNENKAKEYEKIIGKLPNIDDWEAEVLKLLLNE